MAEKPEESARAEIDRLLAAAGWALPPYAEANIHASRGVAIFNVTLRESHGFADYLLPVDGKAADIIEANKLRHTLTGVQIQSDKHAKSLPDVPPAWRGPLPFLYESTGVEPYCSTASTSSRARAEFCCIKTI